MLIQSRSNLHRKLQVHSLDEVDLLVELQPEQSTQNSSQIVSNHMTLQQTIILLESSGEKFLTYLSENKLFADIFDAKTSVSFLNWLQKTEKFT